MTRSSIRSARVLVEALGLVDLIRGGTPSGVPLALPVRIATSRWLENPRCVNSRRFLPGQPSGRLPSPGSKAWVGETAGTLGPTARPFASVHTRFTKQIAGPLALRDHC